MNLPSNPKAHVRSAQSGLTMIEAMLAFVILVMVLVAAYGLIARNMTVQSSAKARYEMTAMARAVLDEYVVTYPRMEAEGTYGDFWQWSVTEELAPRLMDTDMDRYFRFLKITVTVSENDSDRPPVTLSTVLARRAE